MIIDPQKSNEYYLSQKNKANQHNRLFHYTDLDCLSAILRTKSFKLNNIRNMSDLIENQRLDYSYKGKIYISCFTSSEPESIPLWYLYGVMKNYSNNKYCNKEIIRLSIENLTDKSFGIPYFVDGDKNILLFSQRSKEGFYIKDLSVLDVLYQDELIDACIEHNPFDDEVVAYFPTLSGYVKGSAWSFEQETRIRLGLVYGGHIGEVEKKVGCRYILKEPKAYNEIFLPIMDSVLGRLKLTFSPWADEAEKEKIREVVKSYLPDIREDCFMDSSLEGKISIG